MWVVGCGVRGVGCGMWGDLGDSEVVFGGGEREECFDRQPCGVGFILFDLFILDLFISFYFGLRCFDRQPCGVCFLLLFELIYFILSGVKGSGFYDVGCLVHGLWFMVYGLWFMVYGLWLWFMVYGLWFMVYGLWFMVYSS